MASHGHEPSSGEQPLTPASPNRGDELQKKRARDRKSQQAMRDRTKWHIKHLESQVAHLTQIQGERDEELCKVRGQLRLIEGEVDHLRDQNAALRLRLMGQSHAEPTSDVIPRWQIPPSNVPPTCMADQIIQNLIKDGALATSPGGYHPAVYADKPNLCALLDKDRRAEDVLCNIVGDIILSYKEAS
jgi:hypothetical protein